jgi:hypothetical protein
MSIRPKTTIPREGTEMSRREVRAFSAIGLVFGVGMVYFGATTSCACPAQIVGQPTPFNWLMAEVNAGLVVILVSAIGLVFSFRKPKTTQSETP